jgi:hypothetical protein
VKIGEMIGTWLTKLGEAINGEKPEKPVPSSPLRKTEPWVIVVTTVGAIVLLILGALTLKEGKEMWTDADSPVVVNPPTKELSKVIKKRTKNDVGKPRTTIVRRTAERKSQDGGRSTELAIAILATGAGLLLAGGLAARLSKLKLPGVELEAAYQAGAERGLEEAVKAGAKVNAKAQEKGKQEILGNEEAFEKATIFTARAAGTLPPEGLTFPSFAFPRRSDVQWQAEPVPIDFDEQLRDIAASAAVDAVSEELDSSATEAAPAEREPPGETPAEGADENDHSAGGPG